MATDYLNVRNEINEMRQRKLELEETLKMSDEDLLRSVIRNDRNHQGQLPSGAALHVQPDPAEVEQYLQLTTEKVREIKFFKPKRSLFRHLKCLIQNTK